MHKPKAGERVFVNGLEAIFVVAHIYHKTQTADLVPVGRGPIKEDVPWRKLFRCWSSNVEKVNAAPGLRRYPKSVQHSVPLKSESL